MTEEEKIRAGILFDPNDPELVVAKRKAHKLNLDYNRLYEDQINQRTAILNDLLGTLGEGSYLQGPITFHYGKHTRIGANCFINFNLTVQDDAEVTIGDYCNIGPNVTIVTPVHPMLPNERRAILRANGSLARLCYAKPVRIGRDCWLGANVIICPGVTIGDNCVIGAGSVVTRSVPVNSFAAGNPCRVIRAITEADSLGLHPELLGDNCILSSG